MTTPTPFAGRSILITGAASGIGAATARLLAERGAGRLILVDLDGDALNALDLPCTVERHTADVSDPAFWSGLESQIGKIDHAVVNAGIAFGGPLAHQPFEDWRKIMAVNLDGAFLALGVALRSMLAAETGGSIVLTSSVTAVKALPGTGAYGISKAGISHMTKLAALENAAAGVRVNAIAPGGVDTPIWDGDENFAALAAELGREAAITQFAAATPNKRFASPEEIAASIAFLLSDESANITGIVLSSDGGLSL